MLRAAISAANFPRNKIHRRRCWHRRGYDHHGNSRRGRLSRRLIQWNCLLCQARLAQEKTMRPILPQRASELQCKIFRRHSSQHRNFRRRYFTLKETCTLKCVATTLPSASSAGSNFHPRTASIAAPSKPYPCGPTIKRSPVVPSSSHGNNHIHVAVYILFVRFLRISRLEAGNTSGICHAVLARFQC